MPMLGVDAGVVIGLGVEDGLRVDAGADADAFGEKESAPVAGDEEAATEQPATRPAKVSPTARPLSCPRLVRWW
jgi:hypothetical protein